MSENTSDRNQVISVIKEWVSPILIGIIGMLIWRDMTELRSDVKVMLINVSSNTVRISNLENDVNTLKQAIIRLSVGPDKK